MTTDEQEAGSTNSAAHRLAPIAPHADSTRFTHSRAVVIGIDRYQHIRALNTAVSDTRRLADFLQAAHGYDDVLLLEDATREMLAAELGMQLKTRVGKDNRLLLYFAGHGIAVNGDDGPEGFLIPADARTDDRTTFVAMADLYRWLDALPCRHLLVILDCCFAGAFTWYGRRNLAPIGATFYREHYDRFLREPAWQILTSAAHDQEALDVLGGKPIGVRGESADAGVRHSPFADALFAALQGEGDLIPKGQGDGVVTATELYLYLRDTVERRAEEEVDHRQTPELWPFSRARHGKGEFIFLVPGHGEPDLEPAPELTTENNPYRGLQSYDEKHAALFFGRSALIEKLAAAVDEHPLTVVLGASGTGKSSVVKAGVVPFLRYKENDQHRGTEAQRKSKSGATRPSPAGEATAPDYFILPPMRPGDAPLRVLTELLAAHLPGSPTLASPAELAAFVANAFDSWLAAHPEQRLLLVVDQAEELVTLCREDAVRDSFLQTLADLLATHLDRMRVIFTLRTDFEPQFQDLPIFAPRPSPLATRFVVPPMSQAELREVIEAPAAVRVLFFDPPALVDTLIDEVIQTPGALPLLSFTLEQLYLKYIDRQSAAQRDGITLERALTAADYAALGGVIGSLRRRADEVYADLPDDAHRATMERVVLRMVAVEGGELARRRVIASELKYPTSTENDRVATVLARLDAARLTVGDDPIEPAHDALIAAWDRLLQWKRQAEEYLPLQRRLGQAASEWEKALPAAQSGMLWDDDPRLPQVEETLWPTNSKQTGLLGRMRWAKQVLLPTTTAPSDTRWLNAVEVKFVQTSVQQRSRFWRRVTGAIATFVLVLVVATSVSLWLQDRAVNAEAVAVDEARRARNAEATAVANEQIAKENQAKAEREARIALSRQLAAQSEVTINQDRDAELSLLLAIEAVRATADAKLPNLPEADASLRRALDNSFRASIGGKNPVVAFAQTTAGLRVVVAPDDGTVQVYDASNGAELAQFRDSQQVRRAYLSDDGMFLVTVAENLQTIILWSLAARNEVNRLVVGESSPDIYMGAGEVYAVTRENNTRRLWQLREGREIKLATNEPIRDLVLSPQNELLAAVDTAGAISLHHTDGQKIADLAQTDGPVRMIFNHTGAVLATADEPGKVHLWDTATGDVVAALTAPAEEISKLVFSPDDAQLVGRTGKSILIWTLTADPAPTTLAEPRQFLRDLTISPDGNTLVLSSAESNTAVLFDLAAAGPIADLVHEEWWIRDIAFSPDSTFVATASLDGTTQLWDTADGDLLAVLPHDVPALEAFVSDDGQTITTVYENNEVRVWPVGRDGMLFQLAATEDGLAFSDQGKWLASYHSDADSNSVTAIIRDVRTGAQKWNHALPDDLSDIAVIGAGNLVKLADRQGRVQLWDIETDELVFDSQDHTPAKVALGERGQYAVYFDERGQFEIQHLASNQISQHQSPAGLTKVMLSPDESRLALLRVDGTAAVYSTSDGSLMYTISSNDAIEDLVFDAADKYVAVLTTNDTVAVWSQTDGKQLQSIAARGAVTKIAFNTDGTALAVVTQDETLGFEIVGSTVSIFAIPSGRTLAEFSHEGQISELLFSRDSKRLVTLSKILGSANALISDSTVRLWDIAAQAELATFHFSDSVADASFGAEDSNLFVATENGEVWSYTLDMDSLLAAACTRVTRDLTAREWSTYFGSVSTQRPTCE